MANRMVVNKLLRLTLVRKSGGKIAKHPDLRLGVVETIKAGDTPAEMDTTNGESQTTVGEAEAQEGQEGQGQEVAMGEWYTNFSSFIATVSPDDIPDGNWEEAYSEALKESAAKQRKNYPNSEGPFAGPHNSFPIRNQSDVYDAARLIGHASNPAAVKARIISIARSHGYKLPKSWAKASKAMDATELGALISTLATEIRAATEVVEKASRGGMSHQHTHNHATEAGYGYSHAHDHSHASMDNHDTSESAHGHEHAAVTKAGDTPAMAGEAPAEDSMTEEEQANLTGVIGDVKDLKEKLSAIEAKLTEASEKLSAAPAAPEGMAKDEDVVALRSEVETLKAALVDESRKPLTAAPPSGEGKPNVKGMAFDEAVSALLHG